MESFDANYQFFWVKEQDLNTVFYYHFLIITKHGNCRFCNNNKLTCRFYNSTTVKIGLI